MGTQTSFYVRTRDESVITDICTRFSVAVVEDGDDFTGFILPNGPDDPPCEALARLSSNLNTEVIWLSFQSVVDAFEFHHWRAGQKLRSLIYGCRAERTWESVEGQEEAWERAAFFRPYSAKLKIPEDQRRERERICREAVLSPGEFEPCIDARESAREAAEYYRFPGWS